MRGMRSIAVVARQVLGTAALACTSVAQEPPKLGRITGLVLDALGNGVPAARISVSRYSKRDEVLARTLSDTDGMFVVANLPLDQVRSLHVLAESKTRCVGSTAVQVTNAAPETWTTLRLWDAGTLEIRIVDEQGAPIANALGLARPHRSRILADEASGRGVSDADGKLTMTGLPLGAVEVRAWREGYQLASEMLWLKDTAQLELKMSKGDGLSLKVRVAGLPERREARVSVAPYERDGSVSLPGLTPGLMTTNGTWSMSSLPDLEYHVWASLEGFVAQPRNYELPAGKDPHDVTFTMQPIGSVRLRGVLRDATGKPLAGEAVSCGPYNSGERARGTTDADGRFTLDSTLAQGERAIFELPDPRHTLAQIKDADTYSGGDPNFLGWHEFVVDPTSEYALVAIPTVTIEGKVIDDDGKPLRGRRALLQTSRAGSRAWTTLRRSSTNIDGAFAFRGAYPMPTAMRVSLGEQDSAASEPFVAPSGTELRDLVLTAVPLGIVEGVLADAQGQPLVGARVWLRNVDPLTGRQKDGSMIEILSDREGRYRFIDVEPGGHRVEVRGLMLERLAASEAFELGPGATANFDLVTKH